ncbi:hypothetical protein BX600DRAFT_433078 [Xylariales sp. PMI_506]|nr:hypothetical protein BX600DRAFT_433078 [Xylariales sp. PMI_506]
MAPICKFYQQGNCRNGMNCRFEHPGANQNPFGAPNNNNRFGALNSGGGAGGGFRDTTNPYKITKDGIKIDLVDERPHWILSSYGPGKDAPEQLFGGFPREQSFEEIRLSMMSSPNPQQALQEIQQLYQQAEQQVQTSLNNLDGAVKFLLDAENNHPNRNDICKQNSREGGSTGAFAVGRAVGGITANPFGAASAATQNPFAAAQSGPFGTPAAAPSTGAFGQPSQLGAKPNPFGQPTGGSAFGQPSQLGAATGGSAFGQPSQLGSTGGSAFGQPSQLGATGGSAFGQPSQLGATGGSAFGQPSQLGTSAGSAFGQPSSLGAKPNPFGSPSGASGFNTTTQPGSAFGQPSTIGQKPNPFGSPSPSPFSAPSQPQAVNAPSPAANPFGQPSQTSGFGTPAAANPFSAMASPSKDQDMVTSAPSANPFSQPSGGFGNNTGAAPNPFTQAQAQQAPQEVDKSKSPYPPGSSKQHPPAESYISRMGNRVIRFKNLPVAYQDGKPGVPGPGGKWQKIWFPDGPPAYYKATEPENPAEYTPEVKRAYEESGRGARFSGAMPTVPPMREECVWDF